MDPREQFITSIMKHQGDLRAFIGSIVWDRHLCEDIMQEVAMVLWRKYDSFDQTRSFAAWARGIALNIVKQHVSDARQVKVVFSDAALQQVSTAYEQLDEFGPDEQQALRDCLSKLPDKSRELLTERYDKGRKLDEIAGAAGSTIAAIHMTLTRLRAKLQKCIEYKVVLVRER